MDKTASEFPKSFDQQYGRILLALRVSGTIMMIVAICYCLAGGYLSLMAAHDEAIEGLQNMVISGASAWTHLARLAIESYTAILACGVSISLLALTWLWLLARCIPHALYAAAVGTAAPFLAGLVLHTGSTDVYTVLLRVLRA